MSTHLLIILGFGATLACWAVLTLMGGERARRLHQLQAQRPAAPVAPPAPPTPVISVPAVPVVVAQAAASARPLAKPQAAKNTR